MVSTVVTETYLIVASVILASVLSVTVLAGMNNVEQSYSAKVNAFVQKNEVSATVIFAYGSNGATNASIWVKDTGSTTIPASLISQSDIFFGPVGDFQSISYGTAITPYWTYSINGSSGTGSLAPGETMQVTVHLSLSNPLARGDYFVRFTTYVGTSSDYTFSI